LDTRTQRHQSTSVYTGRNPKVRPHARRLSRAIELVRAARVCGARCRLGHARVERGARRRIDWHATKDEMSLSLLTIATLTVLATLAINRLVTLTCLEEVGEQLVERVVAIPCLDAHEQQLRHLHHQVSASRPRIARRCLARRCNARPAHRRHRLQPREAGTCALGEALLALLDGHGSEEERTASAWPLALSERTLLAPLKDTQLSNSRECHSPFRLGTIAKTMPLSGPPYNNISLAHRFPSEQRS
jgi:hypothetical protein